jgi:hypothetical protein
MAAKRGEIQPKPKPMSKRKAERLLMQEAERKMIPPQLRAALIKGGTPYEL